MTYLIASYAMCVGQYRLDMNDVRNKMEGILNIRLYLFSTATVTLNIVNLNRNLIMDNTDIFH